MEEEKAAAYYDELTRKGEGAARFKQGLGFSSQSSDSSNPTRGSAILSSTSFLSNFVRASSPGKTTDLQKQTQLENVQNKLKKKQNTESLSRVSDKRSPSREIDRLWRRRSRSRDRHDSSRRYRSSSRERTGDRDRGRDRERKSERRRRSRSRSSSNEERRRYRSSSRDRAGARDRDRDRDRERKTERRRRSRSRSSSLDEERRRGRSSRENHSRRRRSRSSSTGDRRLERGRDDGHKHRAEGKKEKENNVGVDYSRLIKGYAEMTAAERVKAKMKLQLAQTAEKDTAKGMGAGWERFEFNKDAPLEDEEMEVTEDDASVVKNIGQSFRFSAVESRREEQIKAAHDEAMFGAPAAQPYNPTEDEPILDEYGKESKEIGLGVNLISEKQISIRKRRTHAQTCAYCDFRYLLSKMVLGEIEPVNSKTDENAEVNTLNRG
ncbi:hypothetical protein BVC80_9097g215 [Macleaya cordata]|uniref:Uncharacterized protein n=1 Tax=Macleaya cordata TaxID=56857 RepID=A0A200QF38_MACCD|nr:hypothetical protein BVC80_9097g215 [Macleaya cordata]